MKVEFRQGVSAECIKWLKDHIGPQDHEWRYERATLDDWHVPCIIIDDEKQAIMFALIWS